jgi:hypothetical protein
MLLETILGGVTGLIGNVVGGIFKYKHAKLEKEMLGIKNTHALAMVTAESDAMIAEAKANIAITRAQVEGAIELKDAEAYIQSQKEGNKALFSNKWIDKLMSVEGKWKIITLPIASLVAFLFGMTDFLRGILRPVLTIYLCGATTWITLHAIKIMNAQEMTITATQALTIFQDTTSIVTYLTVSCVTWWFGDRRMGKNIMELKGVDRTKIDDEIKI